MPLEAVDGARPMTQPNDLSRSLLPPAQNCTLIIVIKMGQSSWLAAGLIPGAYVS
jgi:transposase